MINNNFAKEKADDSPDINKNISNRTIDRFQIFEAIALERLSIDSEGTKPASFIRLPVRLAIITTFAIAGFGVCWSFFARIPYLVEGYATFVPRGGMSSLVSFTTGNIYYQVSGLGRDNSTPNSIRTNSLLTKFRQNLLSGASNESQKNNEKNLINLVKSTLLPVAGQRLFLPDDLISSPVKNIDSKTVRYAEDTLIARVINPLDNQELYSALQSTLPTLSMEQQQEIEFLKRSGQLDGLSRLQIKQRLTIASELNARRDLYQRKQNLWERGFLPGIQLMEEQAQINQIQNQLLNSDSNNLNTRINSQEQRTKSQQASVADIEARNKLVYQLVLYLRKTGVFVPQGGIYLLSNNFANGGFVQEGDELMTYSKEKPALPMIIPVFLNSIAFDQVAGGMKVLVTPRGISRAEYGGIPGTVVKVSKLPLSSDGVRGTVGSVSIAKSIQQLIQVPYVVMIELQQAEPNSCKNIFSQRCYRWSSGRIPPYPVRLGALADVQIISYSRHPVEFVMPFIRRTMGLVVDNK